MLEDKANWPACVLCGRPECRQIHQRRSGAGFFECRGCEMVFLDPRHHLGRDEEKRRYMLHENDPADSRYRRFLTPVAEEVVRRTRAGDRGLDFGAGPGPVLAEMLELNGRSMALYDPFFHPHFERLEQVYDFIVCTEAAEHFHRPAQEFEKMRLCLRTGGFLVIMTQMIPESGFTDWYYHRDPTHVCFYRPKSFAWIGETYGFSRVTVMGPSLVVLEV